jgi:hypothetical protein
MFKALAPKDDCFKHPVPTARKLVVTPTLIRTIFALPR